MTTKRRRTNAVIIIFFVTGLLIMTYPLYSNAINNVWDNMTMRRFYKQEMARFEADKRKHEEHNLSIAKGAFVPGSDPFDENYAQGLPDVAQEHFIGTISIPKLNLEVPLYDKTSSSLLEIGATVLDGTSMPIGGENTHSVITGHRGLPNRELFTNITKLKEEDLFVIDVFGEKIAYKVISTQVVLPYETDSLQMMPGEDLVTLVTCTPYMINTHRLLVNGTRVEYTEEIEKELSTSTKTYHFKNIAILTGLVTVVFSTLFMVFKSFKGDRRNKVFKKGR